MRSWRGILGVKQLNSAWRKNSRLDTCAVYNVLVKSELVYISYGLLCSTCTCLVFNLPKCIKTIFIAWSVIPISRSAFTMVDHFGTCTRFIHSISISCWRLLVVLRSRCMVLRTDSGTPRHKPSWNQSVTSCNSLTRSFKLTSPAKRSHTFCKKNDWSEYDMIL